VTPGNYLERYLIADYGDVDANGLDHAFASHYRAYADDPARAHDFLAAGLMQHLLKHPGFYVEIRDNALLAFRPENGLEPVAAISELLSFADWLAAAVAAPRKIAN